MGGEYPVFSVSEVCLRACFLLVKHKACFVNSLVLSFAEDLQERLAGLRSQGLYRTLRRVNAVTAPRLEIGGQSLLNFSSNDYLGLAGHPALKSAAIKCVEQFGAGVGASRLICGSLAPFHELEEALAAFKGTEAALVFSTGYATAVGTITALLGKNDIVILDKLVHASIVDAARLCGAKLRVFAHNDLSDLEAKLKWASAQPSAGLGGRRVLVVTETVFSMDGDTAPLREMAALKEKYGAWLMVDEAHATGLLGDNGRGLADQLGVSAQIEIKMGTLGKALGASGGFICGRRVLVDYLVNRARSFIFSTAPVPAAAAAATAAVRLVQSPEGAARRFQLRQRIAEFNAAIGGEGEPAAAIVPVIVGNESVAVAAADELRRQNLFVPAIRYPTVARGAARLRVALTAAHTTDDVALLAAALRPLLHRKVAREE